MVVASLLSAVHGLTLLAISIIVLTVQSARAQDANNSTLPVGCGMHAQSIASGNAFYNSTGTTPFRLSGQDKWHLSYGLIDERRENSWWGGKPTMQTLAVFLSVPESFIGSQRANNTEHCVYLMKGRNETSDAEPGDGNESCSGILPEACIDAVRSAAAPRDGDCPRIDVGGGCDGGFYLWRSAPSNFSDATCSVGNPPGIDLPDDYRSYDAMVGSGLLPSDDARDSFDRYDLRVRQSVPLLITSRTRVSESAWQSDAQIVCLAPSNVTAGSREPEGDFPSAAAAGRWVSVHGLALSYAVAGIAGLAVGM